MSSGAASAGAARGSLNERASAQAVACERRRREGASQAQLGHLCVQASPYTSCGSAAVCARPTALPIWARARARSVRPFAAGQRPRAARRAPTWAARTRCGYLGLGLALLLPPRAAGAARRGRWQGGGSCLDAASPRAQPRRRAAAAARDAVAKASLIACGRTTRARARWQFTQFHARCLSRWGRLRRGEAARTGQETVA